MRGLRWVVGWVWRCARSMRCGWSRSIGGSRRALIGIFNSSRHMGVFGQGALLSILKRFRITSSTLWSKTKTRTNWRWTMSYRSTRFSGTSFKRSKCRKETFSGSQVWGGTSSRFMSRPSTFRSGCLEAMSRAQTPVPGGRVSEGWLFEVDGAPVATSAMSIELSLMGILGSRR